MPQVSAQQRKLDALASGRLVLGAPAVGRDGLYHVTVTDTEANQTVEKTFTSLARANDWITDQMTGVKPHLTAARARLTGCSVLDDDEPSIAEGLAAAAAARRPDTSLEGPSGVEVSKRATGDAKRRGGFALRAVRDVLEEHGLDPTVEIVRVLKLRRPLYRKDGSPMLNPETGEHLTESVLDAETQAKTLLELQQYVTPKLKAVEVIDRTPPPDPRAIDDEIRKILTGGRPSRVTVVQGTEVIG